MNPVIDRAYQLAKKNAESASYTEFQSTFTRLRSLDRNRDVSEASYLAMEGIAHARAKHVSDAKNILSRLNKHDKTMALETRRILLASPESRHVNFKNFVESVLPDPSLECAKSGAFRRMRKYILTIGSAALVIMLAAVVILLTVNDTEPLPDNIAPAALQAEGEDKLPAQDDPNAIDLTQDTSMIATDELNANKKTPPQSSTNIAVKFERMQRLVGRVVIVYDYLMDDGSVVKYPETIGTAFVVRKDGLVLTNKHVVDAGPEEVAANSRIIAWKIIVLIGGDDPLELPALTVQQSTTVDLAWIRVDYQFEDALAFGKTPVPGQRVMAYGYPGVADDAAKSLNPGELRERITKLINKIGDRKELNIMDVLGPDSMTLTVTSGVISAVRNTEMGMMLQTDTFVHYGNSGGPLVDENGFVLGITTRIEPGVESVNSCLAARTVFEELVDIQGIQWPDHW